MVRYGSTFIAILVIAGMCTSAHAVDWSWLYPQSEYVGVMYGGTTGAEGYFIDGSSFGFGAGVMFGIKENLRFGVEYNYVPYRFEHADTDTITMEFGSDPWDWAHWPHLKIAWAPYQNPVDDPLNDSYLDYDYVTRRITHSVLFSLSFQPQPKGKIRPAIYGGIGGHIFMRKFYYQINWERKFPASEDYPEVIQTDEYRHYGDVKKRGVVWTLFGGAGLDLMFNNSVGLNITARYHYRIKDHKFDHWTGNYAVRTGFVFYL